MTTYSLDFIFLYKELHQRKYISNRTDTGWKPELYQDTGDRAIKKTKALLNKINNLNVVTISEQIHSLYITAPEILEELVSIIVSKAILDKSYQLVYIDLVRHLNKHMGASVDVVCTFASVCKQKLNVLVDELPASSEDEILKMNIVDLTTLIGLLFVQRFITADYIRNNVIPKLLENNLIEQLCKLVTICNPKLSELYDKNAYDTLSLNMKERAQDKRVLFLVEDNILENQKCFQPPKPNPWFCSPAKAISRVKNDAKDTRKTKWEKIQVVSKKPNLRQPKDKYRQKYNKTRDRGNRRSKFREKDGNSSSNYASHIRNSTAPLKTPTPPGQPQKPTENDDVHYSIDDQLLQKLKVMMLEYFNNIDPKEFTECWVEITSYAEEVKALHALQAFVESPRQVQDEVKCIFNTLIENTDLTKSQIEGSISCLESCKEQLEIDFPNINNNLNQIKQSFIE